MKIQYVAKDGTPFDTEEECAEYEANLGKEATEEAEILNRFCVFFDDEGNQIRIDSTFDESKIYGVSIKCSDSEAYDIVHIFTKRFDDLGYALQASNFGIQNRVILVYDWVGYNNGWTELDLEKLEWYNFLTKVLGRA